MDRKQYVILTVLKALDGERTIFGAYHLLQGKKSVQTIQDGTLFNSSSYFGVLPISRENYIKEINDLVTHKFIEWYEKDRVKLTNFGKQLYEQYIMNYRFIHDFNGWKYVKWTEIVWLRLLLYIQSLSYLLEQESRFFPLTQQTSIQQWVKLHIPKNRLDQQAQFTSLFNEVCAILDDCDQEQAISFSYQLSSKHQLGLTKKQIAQRIGLSEDTVEMLHKSVIHKICDRAQNSSDFPILHQFIKDIDTEVILTESARSTFDLLQKGLHLEQIKKVRQLKMSTIEDHIVEIAHTGLPFHYRTFVSEEKEEDIFQCVNELNTTKLRLIKNKLGDEYSYFMIRLVMAKRKVQNGL